MQEMVYCAIQYWYSYRLISVEIRSWSGYYGGLFTRLDKYRVFFHTPNCKSVSSLYSYQAIPI